MPRRTKFEKRRATLRKDVARSAHQSNVNGAAHDPALFFRLDITKSLVIIGFIIALEIALYYGTMNNHLSLNLRLR